MLSVIIMSVVRLNVVTPQMKIGKFIIEIIDIHKNIYMASNINSQNKFGLYSKTYGTLLKIWLLALPANIRL